MCLVFHCLQFAEASKSSKESASADQYTPLPASTDISGNHRGAVVVYTTMAHAMYALLIVSHTFMHTQASIHARVSCQQPIFLLWGQCGSVTCSLYEGLL